MTNVECIKSFLIFPFLFITNLQVRNIVIFSDSYLLYMENEFLLHMFKYFQ